MKPRPPLPPGPYLVIGLARSGTAAALTLRARGEEVIGIDAGAPPEAGRLQREGVEVHLNASGDAIAATTEARTAIKSPGVPQDAPAVLAARQRGLEVIGELELAWRLIPNEFIAVTGTNGKTTTTEWIGHVHREASCPVAVAGNVGTAASSLVGQLAEEAVVVCEASSFQLEDTTEFSPEAAVLLNITADHLDRHPSFEDYVEAKLRVFVRQGNEDLAVAPVGLGIEDLGGCARRVCFGGDAGGEMSERQGLLWWEEEPLLRVDELSLPGVHNRQNAMATAAVCLARGIDPEAVRRGLRTFKGVAHRLELIDVQRGVAYVNDSKATNVASAVVALEAYRSGVHLIAGGTGKGQDFGPLAPLVEKRCAAVYLIGDSAQELAMVFEDVGVPIVRAGDLQTAVAAARDAAEEGETVLLSPACASFDQYENFEARGEHFRSLVREGAA